MAIEYDISGLLGKTENDGSTDAGRLTADEWNKLVSAVQENQRAVNGAMKGINYNGTEYKDVRDGILYMTVLSETGRNVKFQWIQKPTEVISKGGSCVVEFNVIDQKKDDEDASVLVPYQNPGKVNFYVDEKLVGSIANVYDSQSDRYTGPVVFDFSKAATLSTKTDGNSLKIEYINSGVTINEYFNVFVLDLSIRVDGFENVYTTDTPPSAKITVTGAECLLYASVDDKTPYMIDGKEIRSDIPETFTTEFEQYNTHGIHVLKVWAVPKSYDGVKTNTLTYNYIFGNTSNKTPIVMSTITEGSEFELYGKMNVEYVAYVSGENGNKDVSIEIVDENNKALISTKQNVSFVNGKGHNKFIFTLFPSGTETLTGERKLIIGIAGEDGTVSYKHTTNIKIVPSTVSLEQAAGYEVYLSSNGRSNSESDDTKRVWSCVSDNTSKNVTTVTFDDNIEFLDTGSGWIADKDGNVAMHLKKGRYFTLNHTPFKWNPTYKNDANGTGDGLTISIEFATRNCLNANAKVIDCMDYTQEETGRGFYVTASSMKLVGNDVELQSKFREDTRIKLDIVIEGTLNKYYYDTVVGTDPSAPDYFQKGNSDECLAIVFVDGVYNGITLIKNSTSFQQGSSSIDPQKIRFGSDDCDLDIYNIRVYNRALTFNEIVKNYSYDTPKLEDKVAISQRNDIFSIANNNMPTIDVGKLRKARPDLPFFYVELDPNSTTMLPQNKSDWKRLTMTKWQNPNAESGLAEEPKTSFEVITGAFRNQGTSSMTYPWPWRNWDWKTGDTELGDKKDDMKYYFPTVNNVNKTGSKWHQMDYNGAGDNLPLKKLTLKKDYASSEMCNNAICSEIYTDMAIGIAKTYPNAVSPAMKADIAANNSTDFKLSLKSIPCFMFHILPDPTKEGSAGTGLDGMGMMNLIPNKNEVGYLGFKRNKWENADKGATEREQSWELCDNLDGTFWVKKLDHFRRNSDGTFVNMIKDVYEARTPKDSSVSWGGTLEADFGMTPKGQSTIEYNNAEIVRDEQYDIIEFHNWLVDTNQYLATDEPLKGSREPWNNDGTGKALYTTDSKEYRKAKFKNEAPDRLIVDQWILYYIWREQFWMFDSGLKNLQVYTVGPNEDNPTSAVMQWGCMVRDADTALGIENTGKDYFPPHIEDIDYYTEENGKITFHYGGAKDIYDITELQLKKGSNAKAVLNGQFASIWINIRECFGAEIRAMYDILCNNFESTNFGGNASIEKFRNHQEHWCENLYNFGMRQYFGGAPFSAWNKSALGDKKNSRAQWLDRGFYYRRGKYRKLDDYSAFRINTYKSPDEIVPELNVKSYIPMYIGCGGTSTEMTNSKNIIRLVDDTYEDGSYGKPISIDGDGFDFPDAGDAVSYIYGTNMLTDIGDLARVCKLLRVQQMNFPKLRQLNLGHEKARDGVTYKEYATKYIQAENGEMIVDPNAPLGEPREFRNEILPNLDCSTLTQLTLLDITNHTNLSELNIKNCDQLQELYARGTILRSIDLPATTSLKKIYLGEKLTSLNLTNLTGIEEIVIESLADCGKLVINNCGDYIATESYKILQQAIDRLEKSYDPVTNPSVVSLRGVKWENADQNMLERLLKINADLTGYIKVGALSNDLKIKLINKYGDIDNSNNALHIEYRQVAITKISMPSKMYIFSEGEHPISFTVDPIGANTYKSAIWTLGANKFATINAETGVITRNAEVADENTSVELTVTVKQMPKADGSNRADLTAKATVYFYERIARPGDIVYNDGSFSDEYDTTKTPIGVCYYVDPEDSSKRLMCALKPINLNADGVGRYIPWGVSAGGINNYTGTTTYWGASPNMTIVGDPAYNCYDIDAIPNYTTNGTQYDTMDPNVEWFSDEVYRDPSNEKNGFFKEFKKTTYYGDLGWKTAYKNVEIDNVVEDSGKTIKNITINSGDSVPSGWYNTLAIIEHRNKILDEYSDDTRNPENSFRRPVASEFWDELYDLSELVSKASKWYYEERDPNISETHGDLLYYPAASACFAYEPETVNILNKFKSHNWFLPSSGDIARICYYIFQSHVKGSTLPSETPSLSQFSSEAGYKEPANAFYNVFNKGIMKVGDVKESYVSSTERDGNNAVFISMYDNSFSKYGKMNDSTGKYTKSYCVLPVCVF